MAAFKTISDALIAQLAGVSGLDTSRVKVWLGSPEEFVESTRRVPFCGVALADARYPEDRDSADFSIIEEHLTFELTIIASDFRGRGYSLEDSYPLLDGIRSKVKGLDLEIAGLSPWRPVSITKHRGAESVGITVYVMQIAAWQALE